MKNIFNEMMTDIFGSSVGVTVTRGANFLRLRSKPMRNLYVLLMMLVLVFPLYFILDLAKLTETGPSLALAIINAYLVFSVLVALTYRRVFDFSNGRLTTYRAALGLKCKKTVAYRDISLVLLKTVYKMSIYSLPHLALLKEYRLEIHTSDGKKISIDQAADYKALSALGTAIKKVTSARYNEI